MNWGGFPIGFRFPVEDFSLETKKRCWSYVVLALRYADLTDSTLLEAESAELFDPDRLIYMAIVAPKSITHSRKNSLLWRKDGRLMSALALHVPVVQENYLELYTHAKALADITPDRSVVIKDGAEGLLPDRIELRQKAPFHTRALILPKGELPFRERDALCRDTMRKLYEQDEGLYLKILPMSPGGEGTVYTAVAFQHGRLFSEMIPDASGAKHCCLFGVLPGYRLLIDGFTVPDIAAPLDEGYGLGKAIRIAKDRGFKDYHLCARGLKPPKSEAEPMEDAEVLYDLSRQLRLYDRVILTEYDADGRIKTENVKIDRRDKGCVSSILSKRSGTAES